MEIHEIPGAKCSHFSAQSRSKFCRAAITPIILEDEFEINVQI
jgi:hypothetical protein